MRDVIIILYHFWRARRLMGSIKTRKKLEQWQNKCLTKFIKQTLCKSPFYKEYITKSLDEFPIINKQIMMEEFDRINTAGITLNNALEISRKAEDNRDFTAMIGDITVGLSSGTSGKQSIFLASKDERLRWAGIMLAKALPGKITESHKIAFFLRANSNLYTTLSKNSRIQFHFFDLIENFVDNLDLLNKFQPTILTAPASVLKKITQAQENKQINIAPNKIFSVAEVLDKADQSYIEDVFKKPLHQIYQCTEGFLAITMNNGKIYLNEEYIHIEKEWIDKESGRFVPIITDFSRTTQPIVRYRLDDVLVEDLSDTSPFTCLRAIEGRCDDICYFESNDDGLVPVFADILRQSITSSNANFKEYKLIQHSPQHLEIQLLPILPIEFEQSVIESIKQLCERQDCQMPKIYFTKYEASPIHHKLKRIERRFAIKKQVVA